MKNALSIVLLIAIYIGFMVFVVDIITHPECYSTTMKYQLKQKLEAGDPKEIEYYENNYVAKGRYLFEGGEEYVRSN